MDVCCALKIASHKAGKVNHSSNANRFRKQFPFENQRMDYLPKAMALVGLLLAATDYFGWLPKMEASVQQGFRWVISVCPSLSNYFTFPFLVVLDSGRWPHRWMRILSRIISLVFFLAVATALAQGLETILLSPEASGSNHDYGHTARMIVWGMFPVIVISGVVILLAAGFILLSLMVPFFLLQKAIHFLAMQPKGITGFLGFLLAFGGVYFEFFK